jgi:hypothetical protein
VVGAERVKHASAFSRGGVACCVRPGRAVTVCYLGRRRLPLQGLQDGVVFLAER